MDKQLSVIFQAPRSIVVEEAPLPKPGPGEVLVEAQVSAISSGTEMLFYRGLVPEGAAVDETIEALTGTVSYPLRYGYALVGTVAALGRDVPMSWLGQTVFVFAPHQSHVVCPVENLLQVPEGLPPELAVLLPSMETAVSFLMDGRPAIGERVAVFGQGVIGLLVTMLLADYPLSALVTADSYAQRRDWSIHLGADHALDPLPPDFEEKLIGALASTGSYRGADLLFELSGNPQALNQAVAGAGFDARIIVGSWYGQKTAPLDLGNHFHRSQIEIVSSQVSHIAPRWRGRFDKARRLQIAWAMLARYRPSMLITHRFPVLEAPAAYQMLDVSPDKALQVLLEYGAGNEEI